MKGKGLNILRLIHEYRVVLLSRGRWTSGRVSRGDKVGWGVGWEVYCFRLFLISRAHTHTISMYNTRRADKIEEISYVYIVYKRRSSLYWLSDGFDNTLKTFRAVEQLKRTLTGNHPTATGRGLINPAAAKVFKSSNLFLPPPTAAKWRHHGLYH